MSIAKTIQPVLEVPARNFMDSNGVPTVDMLNNIASYGMGALDNLLTLTPEIRERMIAETHDFGAGFLAIEKMEEDVTEAVNAILEPIRNVLFARVVSTPDTVSSLLISRAETRLITRDDAHYHSDLTFSDGGNSNGGIRMLSTLTPDIPALVIAKGPQIEIIDGENKYQQIQVEYKDKRGIFLAEGMIGGMPLRSGGRILGIKHPEHRGYQPDGLERCILVVDFALGRGCSFSIDEVPEATRLS